MYRLCSNRGISSAAAVESSPSQSSGGSSEEPEVQEQSESESSEIAEQDEAIVAVGSSPDSNSGGDSPEEPEVREQRESESNETSDQDDTAALDNYVEGLCEGLNGDEQEDNSDASIDSTKFDGIYEELKRRANKYTKIGKEGGTDETDAQIVENVRQGSRLAHYIGSRPSKAIKAYEHAAAISEAIQVKANSVGAVCPFFTVAKYLDLLKSSCRDDDGMYDRQIMEHILGDEVAKTSYCTYGLVTMMGVAKIGPENLEVTPTQTQTRTISQRTRFDLMKPTQHEVVRRRQDGGEQESSIDASKKKAKVLKAMCAQNGVQALPLLEYGLSAAENPHRFVHRMFEAALIARDGCANVKSMEGDQQDALDSTQAAASLVIQADTPPTKDATHMRNQQIVTFNAKTLRKFLSDQSKKITGDSGSESD